jgi:hypothetical protein
MADEKPIVIHISPAHKREDLPELNDDACPKCKGPTEMGFGLAGGGYGAYTYCEACNEVVSKTEESDA